MKTIHINLIRLTQISVFFILLLFYSNPKSQPAAYISNAPNLFCGMDNSSSIQFPYFPHNGDTLKALVVFCNFPDGNFEITGSSICDYWPASNYLVKPSWADSIICPTTTNVWNRSLTGLFKESSLGSFWLIGDVYPHLYVFEHNIDYYNNSSRKIGFAVKELLQNIDDSVNFAEYDKFDPEDIDNDNNLHEPDGVVDFIFINFRFTNSGTIDSPSYSGIADLGGRGGRFGAGVYDITLDNTKIKAGFPGSGCIYEMNTPWDIGIPAHEFGEHYTYGDGHSTIMGAYNINGGGIASAYDREFLGWNVIDASSNFNFSTSLADYVTTGDYLKIERTSDTIYLENRRRLSYYASNDFRNWKWLSTDPKYPKMPDSGLVIYRNTGYRSFDIQSANGNWNWATCPSSNNKYKIEFYSSSFNHFKESSVNRFNGESTFDLSFRDVLDLNCQAIPNVSNTTYMGVNGDSNTCFDVGYNEVYSPWSNPPLPVTNSNDSLTIEITGRNSDGSLALNIYFTNILGASPSKPQGLTVQKYSTLDGFNPKLEWNKNLEPDLSSYIIYRGYIPAPGVEPSSFDSIANTTDTSFVDESVFLYGSGSEGCFFLLNYSYKIASLDYTNKKSVKSEKAAISGYLNNCAPYQSDENLIQNIVTNSKINLNLVENNNVKLFKLFDNYPNPFNPTTNIDFDLPEAYYVSLKIYDIMGREIQSILNENIQKGRHSVLFNAVNLPSGIYYYKLLANSNSKAGNYVSIKKMILLK